MKLVIYPPDGPPIEVEAHRVRVISATARNVESASEVSSSLLFASCRAILTAIRAAGEVT